MTDTAVPSASPAEVVVKVARAFERDRYLSALLAPRAVRDDLVAITAFAGELARIPAAVSEPMIGEIRLQWWRDALTSAFETPARATGESIPASGHPIADAVVAAARRHGLPLAELVSLIDAQSDRLEDAPFSSQRDVIANARRWDGGLFRMAGRIVAAAAPSQRSSPNEFLVDAGELYGVARILADVVVDLSHGRTLLPANNANGAIATPDDDGRLEKMQDLEAARQQLSAWATGRLTEIAARYQEADRAVRLAALPLALVRPYLTLCQKTPLRSAVALDVSPLTRVWRLWTTRLTGSVRR